MFITKKPGDKKQLSQIEHTLDSHNSLAILERPCSNNLTLLHVLLSATLAALDLSFNGSNYKLRFAFTFIQVFF